MNPNGGKNLGIYVSSEMVCFEELLCRLEGVVKVNPLEDYFVEAGVLRQLTHLGY